MEQVEFVKYAARVLNDLNVPYMLVGSYGSSIHGESRLTHDIDVLLELTPIDVPDFCAAFPAPDFLVYEPAVYDALVTRVPFNVLAPASGQKLDIMFPNDTAWGRSQLDRRQPYQLAPDVTAFVACPEDIILGKLWYYAEGGSEKHLRDIAGILRISAGIVDRAEVTRWAAELGLTPVWEMVQRLEAEAP